MNVNLNEVDMGNFSDRRYVLNETEETVDIGVMDAEGNFKQLSTLEPGGMVELVPGLMARARGKAVQLKIVPCEFR